MSLTKSFIKPNLMNFKRNPSRKTIPFFLQQHPNLFALIFGQIIFCWYLLIFQSQPACHFILRISEAGQHIENGIEMICISWISLISNDKYFLLVFICFWFEYYKYYKNFKHIIFFMENFKFKKNSTFWASWKNYILVTPSPYMTTGHFSVPDR